MNIGNHYVKGNQSEKKNINATFLHILELTHALLSTHICVCGMYIMCKHEFVALVKTQVGIAICHTEVIGFNPGSFSNSFLASVYSGRQQVLVQAVDLD